MRHHTSIIVRKRVGENPNYRNSASELFTGVLGGPDELVVDFCGVDFISRGFADQFHKERLAWQERNGIQVRIENASEDVQQMLQVVSNTQVGVHLEAMAIPIIPVANVEELKRLMLQA